MIANMVEMLLLLRQADGTCRYAAEGSPNKRHEVLGRGGVGDGFQMKYALQRICCGRAQLVEHLLVAAGDNMGEGGRVGHIDVDARRFLTLSTLASSKPPARSSRTCHMLRGWHCSRKGRHTSGTVWSDSYATFSCYRARRQPFFDLICEFGRDGCVSKEEQLPVGEGG
jgi:hypothetical protein